MTLQTPALPPVSSACHDEHDDLTVIHSQLVASLTSVSTPQETPDRQ